MSQTEITPIELDFSELEVNTRQMLLACWYDCDYDDVSAEKYPDNAFSVGRNHEYLVLTDEEADAALSDALDNLLEEIVLSQIPENLRRYFDEDSWKDDNDSDRGAELNHYDGSEEEDSLSDYVDVQKGHTYHNPFWRWINEQFEEELGEDYDFDLDPLLFFESDSYQDLDFGILFTEDYETDFFIYRQ